jgi:hypothetical protein
MSNIVRKIEIDKFFILEFEELTINFNNFEINDEMELDVDVK